MTSNKNDNKAWLLPEFGLLSQASHYTQKRLKAKSPTVQKATQAQIEAEFNNGFKKGYDAGLAQALPEINKKIAQLNALMTELSQYKNTLDEQVKTNLHQFVMIICEKILMGKLADSENSIQNIISRALSVIESSATAIKLYCNEALLSQLSTQNYLPNEKLSLEKDNTLQDYNFRIESDKQFLVFNLQDSLKELIDVEKISQLSLSQ